MRQNVLSLSREKRVYRAQVLAEMGRRLREAYTAEQPLPDRLVDLMRRIEQLPKREFEKA